VAGPIPERVTAALVSDRAGRRRVRIFTSVAGAFFIGEGKRSTRDDLGRIPGRDMT